MCKCNAELRTTSCGAVDCTRKGHKTPAQKEAIDPISLFTTHIFDGEEVVSGGPEGQDWIATFASPKDAELFIAAKRYMAARKQLLGILKAARFSVMGEENVS